MEAISQSRRGQALKVLRAQLLPNEPFTGDILHDALLRNGFANDEAGKLIGSLIRTASSNGWIKKTDQWIQSKRNNSNIQMIWEGHSIP
jgi:hypothetical protein